jgi:hypothetical protein
MKSRLQKLLTLLAWLLLPLVAVGCSMAYDPKATMYIVFEPERTDKFLSDLADIAKSHKLDPWTANATPDVGATLHILEAKGRALRIWATNVPLSQEECPGHFGIGNDPGQFMVTVHPALWWRDWKSALKLSDQVLADLKSRGYRVLPEAAQPCSFEYLKNVVHGVA